MSRFKSLSNPILFLSDRPEDQTGLARCARDLATLAARLPQFRVGFLARGGQGLRKLPFTYYSYPEGTGWGHEYLAGVTKDFFGDDHGIVFSNWDISRLGWLTGRGLAPDLAQAYDPRYRNWDAWLYTPVDSVGPDGVTLGIEQKQTLPVFNRVLAASEWGRDCLIRSGRADADWLPHGIWMDKFTIDPKAHEKLGWDRGNIHIGCLMSNQARKDWPVAFETIAHLKEKYGNRLRFWIHTDTMIRYWNLYTLALDYGVNDCLDVTLDKGDEELALRYSACDCTILPSGGEGFSFPVAESLACGTACIVADYAAAQELVEEECRVKPVTFRIDTAFNVQRAVLSGWGFASAVYGQIEKKRNDPWRGEYLRSTVEHLSWERLKFSWIRWLQNGLQ